jgi:hypothetical protein
MSPQGVVTGRVKWTSYAKDLIESKFYSFLLSFLRGPNKIVKWPMGWGPLLGQVIRRPSRTRILMLTSMSVTCSMTNPWSDVRSLQIVCSRRAVISKQWSIQYPKVILNYWKLQFYICKIDAFKVFQPYVCKIAACKESAWWLTICELVDNPMRCYGILKCLISIHVNLHLDYNWIQR